jgi:hypothetical protein
MGFESMVIVTAEVGEIDVIASAAGALLELMGESPDDIHRPAQAFLESVINGSAFKGGDKGDVLLWGGIWNYFREDDFTTWLARLIEATPSEWLTNVQLSWEQEQSESRKVKAFWKSCRGGKLLWAEIPSDMRLHWGVCGDSSPHNGDSRPGEVILDVDGKKFPDHDTCRKCGVIATKGFHWEGRIRRCPSCGDERPVLKAHIWKDEGDE